MKLTNFLRRKWACSPIVEKMRPPIHADLFDLNRNFGRSIRLCESSKVIDCGANIGDYTSIFRRTGAAVYAFEPDPHAFPVLTRRFMGIPNVHLFNKAVGVRNSFENLYFHHRSERNPIFYSASSSLYAEKSNVSKDKYCQVETIRLADFVCNLDQVDLVKMDIEGMEYDVLEDLILSRAIERVKYMVIETHLGRLPQLEEKSKNCLSLLAKHGFEDRVYLGWS